MGIAGQFETLSSYLSLEQAGRVLVVRCTDDFALLELDLETKSSLEKLFDAVSVAPDIGAVVILGSERSFGPEVMDRFWHRVLELDAARTRGHSAVPMTDFRRGESGIRQLSTDVRRCPKAVVIALRGQVVTPFLGASLVCDLRVAAEGAVFLNRAFDFGMPPGGALTYLLPAYVGFGRASELLLEGRDIAAAEALELGIVNRVVPPDGLEEAAMEMAARIATWPPQAVAAVKQLLTQSLTGLSAHYELETSLITRCMYSLGQGRA